jgi:hypothetical protein
VSYAQNVAELGDSVIDLRKRAAEGLLKGHVLERIGWTQYGNRIKVPSGDFVTLSGGGEMWGLTYRARNGTAGDGVKEQMFIFGLSGVRTVRAHRVWRPTGAAESRAEPTSRADPWSRPPG